MSIDDSYDFDEKADDVFAEESAAPAWRPQTVGRRSGPAMSKQGIINPPIDEVLDKVDSKYQLVIFASKRARQINDYYTDIHEGSMFDNVGPLVDATIEDKALSVALHEIHRDKLVITKNEAVEA